MTATSLDKKQQIMTAAEKLFSSRRFHEITMDQVAQAARVGKGTIYRYFQDKNDLFFQVATHGYDELYDLIRQVEPGGDISDRLAKACRIIGDFFSARRQLFRMMQTEEARLSTGRSVLRKEFCRQRGKIVQALADVISAGICSGRIRSDIEPKVLAAILLGMLRTRARDLQDIPEHQRTHETILQLFLQGAVAKGTERI
jgi:AcrR family transcriptional regulator